MITTLPNPAPPTIHPYYIEERHPIANTFALMSVSDAADIHSGDVINLNLATYTDPYAESDCHRVVAGYPRWMQGILVEVGEIATLKDMQPAASLPRANYPADRVFAGMGINHGARMPVVGVLHPKRYGWLSFDASAFGAETLTTIADLKAHLGKISLAEAAKYTESHHKSGTFVLPSGEWFS